MSFKIYDQPRSWEHDTLLPPFHVVSDTHWFHANIVKYCDRPLNHDEIMVERWNQVVDPDDVVLHLGDLFMSKRRNVERFREEITPWLNGHKYLILGNHDDKRLDYESLGFEVIKPFSIEWTRVDDDPLSSRTVRPIVVEFAHYPRQEYAKDVLRLHGHIHNNGYGTEPGVKIASRRGNVNLSVEVIDYTPQPVEFVLSEALS